MGLALEAEDSWEMLFLGLSWIRPCDLVTLGGSDRSCLFQMLTYFLGVVSRVYLVPRSVEDLGGRLQFLLLPDLYLVFYKC